MPTLERFLFAASIRHTLPSLPLLHWSAQLKYLFCMHRGPALFAELPHRCLGGTPRLKNQRLAKVCIMQISRRDFFPYLRKCRARSGLFVISTSFSKAVQRSLDFFYIDCVMVASLDKMFWIRNGLTPNKRTKKLLVPCRYQKPQSASVTQKQNNTYLESLGTFWHCSLP